MIALTSARAGNFASVGGEIVGLRLEPVVTCFLTTAEQDWTLVRLGPLPDEPTEMDLTRQLLMRFTLEPRWVQHTAFYVDLAAPQAKK